MVVLKERSAAAPPRLCAIRKKSGLKRKLFISRFLQVAGPYSRASAVSMCVREVYVVGYLLRPPRPPHSTQRRMSISSTAHPTQLLIFDKYVKAGKGTGPSSAFSPAHRPFLGFTRTRGWIQSGSEYGEEVFSSNPRLGPLPSIRRPGRQTSPRTLDHLRGDA
jgi:hypothetical protein